MDLLVHENETQWNKNIQQTRPRVLIVEDDTSLEPFWLHIIDSIDERAEVKWMTTEEGAEFSLLKWLKKGRPYDLVISDIFLSGQRTGIDLWRESLELDVPFILTSVITPKKLEKMMGDHDPVPTFLQKPLDVNECKVLVRSFLQDHEKLNSNS